MIVVTDHRKAGLIGEVVIKTTRDEFRDIVEWLETVDPQDEATKDLRLWLDEICPPTLETV